jgi:hypothetical protein
MIGMAAEVGVAGWIAVGAALMLAGTALRQKLQDRREARLRGDWDSY